MSLDITLLSEVFTTNITHNLTKMAAEADLYETMWRPDEQGYTRAWQVIEPLSKGLASLIANKTYLEALSPTNGWGSYDGLLKATSQYLKACIDNPDAVINTSR